MQQTNKADKLEIGVLYGFRALMILFVMNFHLWQQSWISQSVRLFGRYVSFDFWTRSSYLFVDGMILMSGFLLYLPYAREQLEGTPVPSVRRFYFNRLVRIVPSYLFAVLVMLFLVAIPQRMYASTGAMLGDVAAHLTFTFLFWPSTYLSTPLNMALWTIAVEVQFYLIFPLLAKGMKKRPALTAGGMMLAAWAYRFGVAQFAKDTSALINQMPAFLDVYAIGMLGAVGYLHLKKMIETFGREQRLMVSVLSMAVFAAGLYALTAILRAQSTASTLGGAELRLSQMAMRLPLAITFGLMMLSASFLPRVLQKLLDNRLMRFLSTISMNLYIWHQVLSVQMRIAWFPDINLLHTDRKLQSAYMVLCISVAILAAMAVTFGLEQPVSRWANKHFKPKE
ncbi:MAG: acyltransferase [Clostridia bacterium]|nr:acyltransferase [Clostridia bacterium]